MKPVKIINNIIYIKKGESPTYNCAIKNDRTGIPYRVDSSILNPEIRFTVRSGVYVKPSNFIFDIPLPLTEVIKFSNDSELTNYQNGIYSYDILDYEDMDTGSKEALYRDDNNDFWYHVYVDGGAGDYEKKYEFRLTFPIPRSYTKELESKTYWYEIALFDSEDNYKEVLLEPHEFVVGGSLSE